MSKMDTNATKNSLPSSCSSYAKHLGFCFIEVICNKNYLPANRRHINIDCIKRLKDAKPAPSVLYSLVGAKLLYWLND